MKTTCDKNVAGENYFKWPMWSFFLLLSFFPPRVFVFNLLERGQWKKRKRKKRCHFLRNTSKFDPVPVYTRSYLARLMKQKYQIVKNAHWQVTIRTRAYYIWIKATNWGRKKKISVCLFSLIRQRAIKPTTIESPKRDE